jgi:RNA polymerase sigma factor (sigma-70 family)
MAANPDDTQINDRLARIQTQWTLVLKAHSDSTLGAAAARHQLLERYSGVVYRYLLGAVRDENTAEELAHEFAVRLLEGAFHRASPERGRFRDYVKTVLINLINDHFKSQGNAPRQFSPDAPDPAVSPASVDSGLSFEQCLQDEVINQTWSALEKQNPKYHAALLMRVENPDLSSRELAERLSANLQTQVTSDWVRKNIERARGKFAELMVEHVKGTLDCQTPDELRAELQSLNLLQYCRSAIERREAKR